LGDYLVISVVFGDACPALVLFRDYVVKDWWTISAHALLVSLSLHLYTLHVDNVLVTVDYLAVLDNAVWYRDFASLNQTEFRHCALVGVGEQTIWSSSDYQQMLLQ
jgi:hypothetical protein